MILQMKIKSIHHNPYTLIEALLSEGRKFSLPEAQEITNNVLEGIVDTNHRLHHSFFYEIRPLIKIAQHIHNMGVADIQFCSKHKEYDGKICFNDGIVKKVEFTRELNKEAGVNEARRIRLLKQQGRAPAFGHINARYEKVRSGRKQEIFEENQPITREVKCDAWYQEISDSLVEAYLAKQNQKYKGYWLGITFNDWELPSLEDKHYFEISCERFWGGVSTEGEIFERVFVVGDSGNFLWHKAA